MTTDWEQDAITVVDELGEKFSAIVHQRRLTDRLLEFKLEPPNKNSASIVLSIAADEVTVSAGKGARFELDGLSNSRDEVRRIVESVASGGLVEKVRKRKISFELHLTDGQSLRGSSSGDGRDEEVPPSVVSYPPYKTKDSPRGD